MASRHWNTARGIAYRRHKSDLAPIRYNSEKMKQAFTLFIIMLIATGYTYSQQKTIVSGVIRDTTGAGLSNTTVHVVVGKYDFTVISRQDGFFSFPLQQNVTFNLEISMKGYSPFNSTYKIPPGSFTLNLAPLILRPLFQELETVTVDYLRPIIIKEDTTEYRASAYPIREGDELDRLLKRLPGMITDTGGNILIRGKSISRIQINGRDYIGGDILTALKNLPADIIDKVQVIDDYGDKARLTGIKSGDPNKVINIILKNNKKNGLTLNMEAGIGNENKYIAKAYSSAFIGDRQIIINSKFTNNNPAGSVYEKFAAVGYSDQWTNKLSDNGALSFWGNDQTVLSSSHQEIFLPGITHKLSQVRTLSGQNNNLNFSNTLLYRPEPNSFLRIGTTFGISQNYQNSPSVSTTLENNAGSLKTTTAGMLSLSSTHGFSTGSILYYEKKAPGSENRLSIEASYFYTNQRRQQSNMDSTTIALDSQLTNSRQFFAIQSSNYHHELAAHLSYFAAVSYRSFIELAYSFNFSSSQNNLITLLPNPVGASLRPIDSLSSNYTLENAINDFHFGYLGHLSKLNFSIGLTAQQALQDSKIIDKAQSQVYRYFDLLPTAEASYSFSQNKKLYLNYRTNSLPPSLQQLQPFTDITNPQYPVEGNPFLKPAYEQTFKLRYDQSSLKPSRPYDFKIGLSYNTISNMIVANYLYPKDSSNIVQKTTYLNRNGLNSVQVDYRIDAPQFSHVKLSFDGGISGSQTGNLVNSRFFKTSSLTLNQGFTVNVTIPNVLESVAGVNYSIAFTRYLPDTVRSTRFPSLNWVLNNRHTFFQSWQLIYAVRQAFTSISNDQLEPNPILMDVLIKRDFLKQNQASLTFGVNNLFDQHASTAQSVSAIGLSQTETKLIHRYFLVSVILKFEKFK